MTGTSSSREHFDLPEIRLQLRGFTLEVPRLSIPHGSILGVYGPSGSGKSTFLKRVLHSHLEAAILVPQGDTNFEYLRAEQNAELAALAGRGTNTTDLSTRIGNYFHRFGMADKNNALSGKLSGGERRRTTLVGALASEAQLLLLDEPFVGLGANNSALLRQSLLDRKGFHKTTVVVSHSIEMMWSLCDEIIVMNEGKVVHRDLPTSNLVQFEQEPISVEALDSLGIENVLQLEKTGSASDIIHIADGGDASELIAFWAQNALISTKTIETELDLRVLLKASQIESTRIFRMRGSNFVELKYRQYKNVQLTLFARTMEAGFSTDTDLVLHIKTAVRVL